MQSQMADFKSHDEIMIPGTEKPLRCQTSTKKALLVIFMKLLYTIGFKYAMTCLDRDVERP